ncbi:MAG: hypothetical protein C0175_02485 [Caldisericum exile]|uniref:Uncharacterized protein n=1 Tax=Caldisericum exile TaxID=693075 RepID=A0A2J6X7R3_9BACT|nr:MAG: hypothetical protein C0175_02485 [Caldisericum exile]
MVKFDKEWGNYLKEFDKFDKAIGDLRDTYNKLVTTRKDKLDSILSEIESKKALMDKADNGKEENII